MSGGPRVLHQQHLFSVLTHVGAAEDFSGMHATPAGYLSPWCSALSAFLAADIVHMWAHTTAYTPRSPKLQEAAEFCVAFMQGFQRRACSTALWFPRL